MNGAHFTIAHQNANSLLECADGNLGNSTDIQVRPKAGYNSTNPAGYHGTDFSKVPHDVQGRVIPSLWKLDRTDIRPTSWMNSIADKTIHHQHQYKEAQNDS